MPKEDMDELEKLIFPDHCGSCHSEWDEGYGYGEPCCTKAESNIRNSVLKWHKKQLQKAVIEARINTAWHLHRNAGVEMMRGEDNDTDEYICTEYIPKLESQLKDMEDR